MFQDKRPIKFNKTICTREIKYTKKIISKAKKEEKRPNTVLQEKIVYPR